MAHLLSVRSDLVRTHGRPWYEKKLRVGITRVLL